MSTISATSNENGTQEIHLKGTNNEEFCFNSWHYHNDYEGINISYYWGEEKKEISHRFEKNEQHNEHTIDVELDAICY